MKKLFIKEVRLSLMPLNLIMLLSVLFYLIPNYPYTVCFIYGPIGFVQLFNLGRENNEMYYSCLLPCEKKNIVTSRFLLILALETAQILLSVPFIFLNERIGLKNAAGLEANWASLGIGMTMLGLFNLLFLTMFYKTGVKTGLPFLFSFVSMFLSGEILDICLAFVPSLSPLFDVAPSAPGFYQYLALLGGFLLFALFTFVSYRRSVKEAAEIEL